MTNSIGVCGGGHCQVRNYNDTLYRLVPAVRAQPPTRKLAALARLMLNGNRKDGWIPAGYTYLGQFIDHDLNFASQGLPNPGGPVQVARSSRTPALDLDSVYEGQWGSNAVDAATGKFNIQRISPEVFDLPRRNGEADIPESRNDENLIIAQLHLIFLRFHNQVIDRLTAASSECSGQQLYEEARSRTICAYRRVVLHDFLPKIAHPRIAQDAWLLQNADRIFPSGRLSFEFVGAAFRFGHSMVLPAYRMNARSSVKLQTLFKLTGRGATAGALQSHAPEWGEFFELVNGSSAMGAQTAASISPVISGALRRVSVARSRPNLAKLNLLRGAQWRLPSGQRLAQWATGTLAALNAPQHLQDLLRPPDEASLRQHSPHGAFLTNGRLIGKLPLWYYFLLEAAIRNRQLPHSAPQGRGGLGPLASLVVVGTILSLLKNSCDDSRTHEQSSGRHCCRVVRCGAEGEEAKIRSMSDFIEYATAGS